MTGYKLHGATINTQCDVYLRIKHLGSRDIAAVASTLACQPRDHGFKYPSMVWFSQYWPGLPVDTAENWYQKLLWEVKEAGPVWHWLHHLLSSLVCIMGLITYITGLLSSRAKTEIISQSYDVVSSVFARIAHSKVELLTVFKLCLKINNSFKATCFTETLQLFLYY